ncbi:MAG TPA: VOC family protein [bacterium]|jgi:catechol 2,3-dioxygenase-like lactoylglutathione lyase family enzyme
MKHHQITLAAFIVLLLTFCSISVYAQDTGDEISVRPNIEFLFATCNDVDEMRHFYTDIVGMEELSYMNEEDWGWLVYQCEGLQFMIFRAEEEVPVIDEFTWQPGPGGGPRFGVSWSIEVPDYSFDRIVETLMGEGIESLAGGPEWLRESYWGITVLDPMGNTVEIYYTPEPEDIPDTDGIPEGESAEEQKFGATKSRSHVSHSDAVII